MRRHPYAHVPLLCRPMDECQVILHLLVSIVPIRVLQIPWTLKRSKVVSFTSTFLIGHLYVDLITNIMNGCASMVKWTKKVLLYTKTTIFLVKCLKVVVKCCLNT